MVCLTVCIKCRTNTEGKRWENVIAVTRQLNRRAVKRVSGLRVDFWGNFPAQVFQCYPLTLYHHISYRKRIFTNILGRLKVRRHPDYSLVYWWSKTKNFFCKAQRFTHAKNWKLWVLSLNLKYRQLVKISFSGLGNNITTEILSSE